MLNFSLDKNIYTEGPTHLLMNGERCAEVKPVSATKVDEWYMFDTVSNAAVAIFPIGLEIEALQKITNYPNSPIHIGKLRYAASKSIIGGGTGAVYIGDFLVINCIPHYHTDENNLVCYETVLTLGNKPGIQLIEADQTYWPTGLLYIAAMLIKQLPIKPNVTLKRNLYYDLNAPQSPDVRKAS